jgi:glutamate dehydrogenase (NAD(P)+)
MISANEALKMKGLRPEDTRVVVQGSGNVGGIGAMLMHRQGYRIVSLSDMYGSIYNDSGLDVNAVLSYLEDNGRLEGFPEAESMKNAEQLELDCEMIVPAATENQITSQNVDRIKAQLIVEGANGPTTAMAARILDDRGVIIVPDILANAGGVTVSYFEWVQDRMGYFWTEEVVNSRLEQIMVNSFKEVAETATKNSISLRAAAYIVAIDRVATVYRLRGMFA